MSRGGNSATAEGHERAAVPLAAGAVHVFWAPEGGLAGASLVALDTAERRRAAGMHPRRARAFRAARALLRGALSQATGGHPASLRIEPDEQGALHLRAPAGTGLRASLAHAAGHVACVVALERPIGLDLEAASRAADALRLAGRFFPEDEARALHDLGDAEQARRAFLRAWTAKEAFAKCLGVGLGGGGLAARVEGPAGALRVRGPGAPHPLALHRETLDSEPPILLAVAARGRPAAIEVRRWSAGGPDGRGPA